MLRALRSWTRELIQLTCTLLFKLGLVKAWRIAKSSIAYLRLEEFVEGEWKVKCWIPEPAWPPASPLLHFILHRHSWQWKFLRFEKRFLISEKTKELCLKIIKYSNEDPNRFQKLFKDYEIFLEQDPSLTELEEYLDVRWLTSFFKNPRLEVQVALGQAFTRPQKAASSNYLLALQTRLETADLESITVMGRSFVPR